MLNHLLLLVAKDLRVDWRRREQLPALVLFALLIWLTFVFAFSTQNVSGFRTTPLIVRHARLLGATPQQLQTLKSLVGEHHMEARTWVKSFNSVAGQIPFLPPLDRATLLQWSRHTPLQQHAAGLLWIIMLLSGVLGLNRSFSLERQNHAWHALLLTPVARPTLWLAKCLTNTITLAIVMLITTLVSALFLQLNLRLVALPLLLIMACGMLGFTILGSLLASLTTTLSGKDLFLPLLLYPLLVPLTLSSVQATHLILAGHSLGQTQPWLAIILCSDILFLVTGILLAKFTINI